MKIITWNVNGIRAVNKKGLKEFVQSENPDILCVQETKAFEDQFLKDVGELEGYKYIWHKGTRAGYAGTAIFYKKNIKVVDSKNHFDEINHFHNDGRITEIEFIYQGENIVLINGYYPNGGQKVTQENMLDYKLEFYNLILEYVKNIKDSGKKTILTGDFNICHTEIDIARPKQNQNSIGFLPIEREKIGKLIGDGNIDVFRHFYPEQLDTYSWWSYRAGARPNNVGWRLDYFIVDKGIKNNLKDIKYMTNILGSDHCPVKLILK